MFLSSAQNSPVFPIWSVQNQIFYIFYEKNICLSTAHFVSAILDFLLFLKCAWYIPTSGNFHMWFPFPGILFLPHFLKIFVQLNLLGHLPWPSFKKYGSLHPCTLSFLPALFLFTWFIVCFHVPECNLHRSKLFVFWFAAHCSFLRIQNLT